MNISIKTHGGNIQYIFPIVQEKSKINMTHITLVGIITSQTPTLVYNNSLPKAAWTKNLSDTLFLN